MKRPSTQDIIDRIYNIVAEIEGITHLDVDSEFDEDDFQVFRIRLATATTEYADVIICRTATEQMTDHDIEMEVRGEMKAWDARTNGKHSSIGAEPMAENRTTATAS